MAARAGTGGKQNFVGRMRIDEESQQATAASGEPRRIYGLQAAAIGPHDTIRSSVGRMLMRMCRQAKETACALTIAQRQNSTSSVPAIRHSRTFALLLLLVGRAKKNRGPFRALFAPDPVCLILAPRSRPAVPWVPA